MTKSSKKREVILTIIAIIILIAIIAFIILKSSPINGKLLCTFTSESQTMKSSFIYEVDFKLKNVTNISSTEKIESDDKELLKNYKESLEIIYDRYKNLDYYDNKIVQKGNTLTTTTKIDYKHLDIDEYSKVDPKNNSIFNNKKIPIKTIEKLYKRNGAKCRYK